MCIVKAPKAPAKITVSAKFDGIGLSRPLPKLANNLTYASTDAGQCGPWPHCFNHNSLITVHTVCIYLLTDAIFIWILQVLKKGRIYRECTCVL